MPMLCILTDYAGLLVFERVQLGGYLVDEPGRVPSALCELVGHVHLDGGGSQEPLHLSHGELHQLVPFGVVGPLIGRVLERPGRAALVVATAGQPDHAHVFVEPVRVPDEEVAEPRQGTGLEALGHVALQTGAVRRCQVRVGVLVGETSQPVEQVLAVPVASRTAAGGRSVIGFGVRRRERHGLTRDRYGREQQQR